MASAMMIMILVTMMIKLYILLFSLLTAGAGYLTYHNIGLQDTNFSQIKKSTSSSYGGTGGSSYYGGSKSIRNSSSYSSTGGNGYYGSGNGGYRPGK